MALCFRSISSALFSLRLKFSQILLVNELTNPPSHLTHNIITFGTLFPYLIIILLLFGVREGYHWLNMRAIMLLVNIHFALFFSLNVFRWLTSNLLSIISYDAVNPSEVAVQMSGVCCSSPHFSSGAISDRYGSFSCLFKCALFMFFIIYILIFVFIFSCRFKLFDINIILKLINNFKWWLRVVILNVYVCNEVEWIFLTFAIEQ